MAEPENTDSNEVKILKNEKAQKSSEHPTRLQLKLNQALGILFVIFIVVVVNYFSFFQYYRKDITSNPYMALSEQTLNIVGDLPGEINLISFAAPEGDPYAGMIARDVERMLREYSYNSKGMIKVKTLDPFSGYHETLELKDKLNLTNTDNVIIVKYEKRSKVLKFSELAEFDNSMMQYGVPPKVKNFVAEREITSAIQELTQGKVAQIYFLTGHGEYSPVGTGQEVMGYSKLSGLIETQNAKVRTFDLFTTGTIPDDADIVVIASPRQEVPEHHQNVIREWLERKGGDKSPNLILILDPAIKSGMETFLSKYGVTFVDNFSLTEHPGGGIVGNTLITEFSDHPVVEWARQRAVEGFFLDMNATRSLDINEVGSEGAPNITKLLTSLPTYWGESDYADQESTPVYDADKDLRGPLTIGVAIDDSSVKGGEVKLKGMKVVALGGGTAFTNRFLRKEQVDLFLNAVNWMLENEKALGISPKVPREFSYTLSLSQQLQLYIVILAVPVLGIVASVLVWIKRRR